MPQSSNTPDGSSSLRAELVWYLRYLHLRGHSSPEMSEALRTLADELDSVGDPEELQVDEDATIEIASG